MYKNTSLDLAQVPGVYVPQFYDLHPDGSVKPNHPDVPERILRRVATPIPAYSLAEPTRGCDSLISGAT